MTDSLGSITSTSMQGSSALSQNLKPISAGTTTTVSSSSSKTSSASEDETTKIKQKVKNSGGNMTASQIAEKYDITLKEAQDILDELKEDSSDKKNENSTVEFTI